MTLAVTVRGFGEARECISEAISSDSGVTKVAVICICRVPLLLSLSTIAGVSPAALERDASEAGSRVARAALDLLPPSVRGTYTTCRSWRDPALRAFLARSACQEVMVARRPLVRRLAARLALRGTGISVRVTTVASSCVRATTVPQGT